MPPEGFKGRAPKFPLEPIVLFHEYWVGKGASRGKVRERDESGTRSFREREARVWAEAWRTPQAAAWAVQKWRWPVVAEYCRLKTVIELDPTSSAALVGQLHRYRDQLGLTPAGLKENGWQIAFDEVGAKRVEKDVEEQPRRRSSRDRMRVVRGDGD